MKDLYTALQNNFTIVNLGCIGDADFTLPERMCKTLTVVEVDAEGGAVTTDRYFKKVSIRKPLSGQAGKFVFRRNSFAGTCSLLEPLDGMVEAYGMERYTQLLERAELDCETLPDLLKANQIQSLDFLKTDIEGLDPEIIRSSKEYLGKTHFIQCELRFRPFYRTEPFFYDTVNLLAEHGYEVLDLLHIDRWKYKTANRQVQFEGRAVWADFLFVLKPEQLESNFANALPEAVAKQVVLACMLGKKNYGEYLLQRFDRSLPEDWKKELQPLVKPRFPNLYQIKQSFRRIFRPMELFLKHRIHLSEHVAIR
jgi:hypothetical protein